MKILFVGDVVGSVGRQMVIDTIPHLKEEKAIDMVICNGENAAAQTTVATVAAVAERNGSE